MSNDNAKSFDAAASDLPTIDTGNAKNRTMGESENFPPDSPSSERDAGLTGFAGRATNSSDFDASLEADDMATDEDTDFDGNLDVDLPASPEEEIPVRNLDIESMDDPVTRDVIRSPDMDAPNVPGEIDIEGLDEDDLDLTDLPADARLDPLEE